MLEECDTLAQQSSLASNRTSNKLPLSALGSTLMEGPTSVAHLMLECHEWRRERETMLAWLGTKRIIIFSKEDCGKLLVLFDELVVETALLFIENTARGKRRDSADNAEARLPMVRTLKSNHVPTGD